MKPRSAPNTPRRDDFLRVKYEHFKDIQSGRKDVEVRYAEDWILAMASPGKVIEFRSGHDEQVFVKVKAIRTYRNTAESQAIDKLQAKEDMDRISPDATIAGIRQMINDIFSDQSRMNRLGLVAIEFERI